MQWRRRRRCREFVLGSRRRPLTSSGNPLLGGSRFRVPAVARRRSDLTSDRAMRRRCRARTPIWKVRGEVTTTKTFTNLGCRVRRRDLSKCCCYDGTICPDISNLIRIFSPVTGRSWQSVNASVAFSTSTTKLLISWRTVRIKFEFDEWICAHRFVFNRSLHLYIHLYVLALNLCLLSFEITSFAMAI